MTGLLLSTLSQGFIFALAALGIYITFRILDFPDLSVDGTFTTGAAICGITLKMGIHPILCILLAIIGGMAAGAITGFLHVKLHITNILSGIIVMIGLYSINLRIMGKSNLHLFGVDHLFSTSNPFFKMIILMIFALCLKLLMDTFFKTETGYILKALGENPKFILSLGFDPGKYKILGLIMANGCVALSGALYSQYQGFADIGMGTGLIVSGLASIVIGEMIFKRLTILNVTSITILGSIIYRVILSTALKLGLNASDLKLVTAVIMVLILSGMWDKFIGIIKPREGKFNATDKKSLEII